MPPLSRTQGEGSGVRASGHRGRGEEVRPALPDFPHDPVGREVEGIAHRRLAAVVDEPIGDTHAMHGHAAQAQAIQGLSDGAAETAGDDVLLDRQQGLEA